VDEVSAVFLLLCCDSIARRPRRDDGWRPGDRVFRTIRQYALLFSVPAYQGLTYRALILQRPRTRCNLERALVAVHSCHHYYQRGPLLP